MARTLVVGDIHGCAEEFEALLEKAGLAAADRVICVGDLFARGPRPERILDLFLSRSNFTFVLGNHDVPMLEAVREDGKASGAYDDLHPAQAKSLKLLETRREDLRDLLDGAPYLIRSGTSVGTRPWVVVHAGVHPKRGLEGTRTEEFLELRQVDELPDKPFWWDAYDGPDLVIFGHTPRPAVIQAFRRGRRVALGLDTGCVYGGHLTGYLPDEDRFVQVKAKRRYYAKE
ncbi:MAG: serine/threonine protein phosphatase [Planctomycetota bacterium]|nr:serine/threonine protein phosphatase [Planctomycetota bacterium]